MAAPLTSKRARTDVVTVLKDYIQTSGLDDQGRLPPERELAQTLGLSRGQLRTALNRLEAEDLIWRHVGKGTFVGSRPKLVPDLEAIGDLTSPREIVEARLILEPELARLAAFRATRRHFEQMAECIDNCRQTTDQEIFHTWDSRFHWLIANAAGNELLAVLHDCISARHKAAWGKLRELFLTSERMRFYDQQHQNILDAISERNGKLARARMLEHLQAVQENLFE
ncbi:FadR/GntR family transcriptional regulator [Reyranella sp. CPCC 100927]|uniref:FadR/GntR family transcriptional regulator n=1 Tax=Reyranella sp. CPCC 100927 TaxID=2599616 RepID=UPI0011B66FB2|nr:FCD domain-containing protein [Reyranella sp. CPCC 100927]TWS97611.1 FadR family transcriptional regulator [Reyranella sp. CPCC 100927]